MVGAGAVDAAELAAVLALATGAALVATGVLGAAGELDVSGDSTTVDVAAPAVAAEEEVVAAVDFVDGLHAAEPNATIARAAAVDSARTCMAAPCSDAQRRVLPPNRS